MKDYKIVALEDIPKATMLPDLNDMSELFTSMHEICECSDGIGLHAVQIGLPYDLFVAKLGQEFENFVSCKYVGEEEKIDSVEGCLSITENGFPRLFKLKRYPKILLKGFKYLQNELVPIQLEVEGFSAIILQHECDHGEGILISDAGVPY